MRYLISLLILLIIYNPSFAKYQKFKDMPVDHFATEYVYKLLKENITNGYPDGTFRGDNAITRYEAASLLLNLVSSKTEEREKINRILSELKTEFYTEKYKAENPDQLVFSGSFNQEILNKGSLFNYRMRGSLFKTIGQSGNFKIDLDTVDAGFGGTTHEISTDLIDIETNVKGGGINYTATIGSDKIIHRDATGILPSYDYTVIQRKKNSFHTQTYFQNLDIAVEYYNNKTSLTGEASSNEITWNISYTYKKLPLLGKTTVSVRPRYLWNGTTKDSLAEASINSSLSQNLSCQLLIGIGNMSSSGRYIKASGKYENDTTTFELTTHKVGSSYRTTLDKYEFIPLNGFDKLIIDGMADIAVSISQKLNNCVVLDFTTDAAMTGNFEYGANYLGTTWTTEIGLKFSLSSTFSVRSFYRGYAVPSETTSPDGVIAISAPAYSDLFGIEARISL